MQPLSWTYRRRAWGWCCRGRGCARARAAAGAAAAEVRGQAGEAVRGGGARHCRGVHQRQAAAAPCIQVRNDSIVWPGGVLLDWSAVFDEAHTVPGATDAEIERFVAEV